MSKTFLKTTKFHIETIIFWPLIYLLWEPFSKKRSHWWNWSKYTKGISKGLLIKGRRGNKTRNNLWDKLILTNFSWRECVILRPKNYDGEYIRWVM